MSRTRFTRFLLLTCAAGGLAFGPPAAASPGAAPVVGGTPAPAGKWLDVAAITDGEFAFCTGTLIAPRLVLTAAHCVDGTSPVSVLLGAIDSEGAGEEIQVVQADFYPDWESTFDVGVLLLAQDAVIAPRPVAPECLVTESLIDAASITLVGFGATTEQGEDFNTTLMEGVTQVLDADCSGGDGCAPAVAPGGEFVAGGSGVDSCFGDSGGPVYLETSAGTVVAGVVSRGIESSPTPCGGGGIYVRPDRVIDWIESTTGETVVQAACPSVEPPDGDDGGATDDGADDGGDQADDDSATDDGTDDGEPLTDGDDRTNNNLTGSCRAAGGGDGAWSALALLGLVGALGRLRRRRG